MTATRTTGHDTTVKTQSLIFRRGLPHLKAPDAATAAARTTGQSPAIIRTHRFPTSIFSQYLSQGESHGRCSLLPRTPCPRLDLSPFTPRSRAASAPRQRTRPQRHPRPARNRIHPFRARCGARLSRYVLALRRPPDVLRDGDIRPSPRPACCGLLARHRTAIARFGTDVAAAGGIGPALAAGRTRPTPAVPGGVPRGLGYAPRSTWAYASGTRRRRPNCTS